MKVCRLASRKNFVSECGNLEFNTHIYRKPVKVSKTQVSLVLGCDAVWSESGKRRPLKQKLDVYVDYNNTAFD